MATNPLKKTIVLGSNVLNISKKHSKTQKKTKPIVMAPSINASSMRKKLLKRISDIKSKEIKEREKEIKYKNNHKDNHKDNHNVASDELGESMEYIKNLKKRQQHHRQKQHQLSKTLKNTQSDAAPQLNELFVDTEMPPELAEESPVFIPTNDIPINISYTPDTPPPYGCLKGGKKQTYRNWKGNGTNKIQTIPSNLTHSNTHTLSRAQRLSHIKQKLAIMEGTSEQIAGADAHTSTPADALADIHTDTHADIDIDDHFKPTITQSIQDYSNKNDKIIHNNLRTKRTTTRKFILGKSLSSNKISVLVKNNKTRKNILNAQKQLKQTNIVDIKKYLKQHGMIKTGSTCPNDILRKMFESAMLSGEITNINEENLVHNFMTEG